MFKKRKKKFYADVPKIVEMMEIAKAKNVRLIARVSPTPTLRIFTV
jgi:hypothetical protein